MESKTIKIFGSPGTGKTTTLLKLLEEKISEGFKPEKIGFVSFTRRAVREARSRVIKKFNLSDFSLVLISFFKGLFIGLIIYHFFFK